MSRSLLWLLAVVALLPTAVAADPAGLAARVPQPITTTDFLARAAGAAKFGIDSGQLALRKTKNGAVQAFAHQMIVDHSAAAMKFRQALAEAKLPGPRAGFDPAHKALWEELSHTLPGKPFAKAYVNVQTRSLRDDLAFFQAYAHDGDDERMKHFAQELVPVLRDHLEQASKLPR